MDRPSRPGIFCRAFALVALGITGCGEPAAPGGTNVLLVTLDTLRADRLGCYGHERDTSPVIDRLAADSFVFEHAIAQSAVTPVSHASIFTGLNPYHHGLRSLHGGVGYSLAPGQLTLAEALQARGYATAGFVSAFPASSHYGLAQGFETWDEDFGARSGAGLLDERGMVDTGLAQRRGDVTTAAVLDRIERLGLAQTTIVVVVSDHGEGLGDHGW
jgi:arylsulfatase A-like enzyme